MSKEELIKAFVESVDMVKENDKIMEMIVKDLGETIENSHTLPKWKIKKIHKYLVKTINMKQETKVFQNKMSKKLMVDENER